MSRKLGLKAQKNVDLVGYAMNNIIVGIHRHFDIVYNV